MRREIIGFFFMNVPINITEARKSVKIKSIKNIIQEKIYKSTQDVFS